MVKNAAFFKVLAFVFALALASSLNVGCVSTAPTEGDQSSNSINLPSLASIVTVEQAERFLIRAQDLRVGARDLLASKVKADGVITPEEMEQLRRFEAVDVRYRAAWDDFDAGVLRWKLAGGTRPAALEAAYGIIVDLLLKSRGIGSE